MPQGLGKASPARARGWKELGLPKPSCEPTAKVLCPPQPGGHWEEMEGLPGEWVELSQKPPNSLPNVEGIIWDEAPLDLTQEVSSFMASYIIV